MSNENYRYHSVVLSATSPPGKQPPRQPPIRHRPLQKILRVWKWEIFTWILSTLALISIASLLFSFKDQHRSRWNAKFELSTAVAALSQLVQSSLLVSVSACIGQLKWPWLKATQESRRRSTSAKDIGRFDDASRGPNGSLLMLLQMRQPGLVHLGALVTVCMLAFSAFVQQAVTLNLKQVLLPQASASIGRSTGIWTDNGRGWIVSDEDNSSSESSTIHMIDLSAALQQGLTEQFVSPSNISGVCSSSHCTWEPYNTLAMCVDTEEISPPDILLTSNDSKVILKDDINNPSMHLLSAPDGADRSLWMTIADPFITINETKQFLNNKGQNETLCSLHDLKQNKTCTLNYPGEQDEPVTLRNPNEGLGIIFLAYYPKCKDGLKYNDNSTILPAVEDWRNPMKWKTFKATFSPCLQTLQSSLNVTTNTTILHTERNIEWNVDLSSQWLKHFAFFIPGYAYTDSNGEKYSIEGQMSWAFTQGFFNTFRGSASFFGPDPFKKKTYSGQNMPYIIDDILGNDYSDCGSNPTLGYNGFVRRMNNVATSFTNAFRTRNSTTAVHGKAWVTEQYYHVRFFWLIPPIIVYLSGTALLFATIFKSRDATTPIWKSSLLVLLGITNHDVQHEYLSAVESEAKERKVRFRQTEKGWGLKEGEESVREGQAPRHIINQGLPES